MSVSNYIELALFAAGILLSVYLFLYRMDRRVTVIEGRCTVHQPVIDSIAELNTKLDKVVNDNAVFWQVIGPHLANVIHSPKAVDRDALMDKLFAGNIARDELPVLIDLLREALQSDRWNEEKRLAGIFVLAHATQLLTDPRYDRRGKPR